MPTPTSTTKAARKAVPKTSGERDALALLAKDHETVRSLFKQYEALGKRAFSSKQKLATQICTELTKHATAEEELFYPAVRAAGSDAAPLVDEAIVEHAAAKELIAQILSMDAEDDLFDAKVKVLSEQIVHHIQEEEGDIFPKARKAGLDLVELGHAIARRKEEITIPPH